MSADAERQFCKKEYRLSELNAKSGYDYTRIKNADNIFLKCDIAVENEKVMIAYDIEGMTKYLSCSGMSGIRIMCMKSRPAWRNIKH